MKILVTGAAGFIGNELALHEAIGFKAETDIKEGLQNFVNWYQRYYK